jgi:hypothetical protein
MAADGNPLETQAQVKRQIMLNGGVMVSVDIPPEFFSYPNSSRSVSGGPRSTIYTDPANLQQDQPGVGHALFCFGCVWSSKKHCSCSSRFCTCRWVASWQVATVQLHGC